jgi:hypothetical protein
MIEYVNCNPTISELYNSRFSKDENKQFKVGAKFQESPITFGMVLTGSDKTADCKISSFVENIYFRTQNGENRKQYTTVKGLARAVKNQAKKYGYTLEKLIIEKGEPDRI